MARRYLVLGMLFLMVLVMYLDRLAIGVAAPRMQADLGLGPKEWGWVTGAFTLAYAAFEAPGGAMGDRIGQRTVLTRIVLWWSGFTALTGAVSGLGPLLAVRFLFGAGEAGAFPNATGVVARWFVAAERARASSAFWIATSAGGMVTPLLVVPMMRAYGWRVPFVVFAFVGVVWALAWRYWYRDPAETVQRKAAPWGVILKDRNFRWVLVMYHCYCWGGYFYLSWIYTYLQTGRGLTEQEMAFASALPPLLGLGGILAGGFLSDWLARRYGLRVGRVAVGAPALVLSGLLMVGATLTRDNTVAVGLLAVGLGVMNMMLPVAWAVCADVGGEHTGAVSGAMNTAGQLGSFVSAVAFGYLVEGLGSYDLALMPLAGMLLVGGAAFAMIDPRRALAV
jgi:MFS family permease